MSKRDRKLPLLRTAAHARHQIVSAACWWWCPPMHGLSSIMHANVVDEFYDALEGEDDDDSD